MAGGYPHDRYILYTKRNTDEKITRQSGSLFYVFMIVYFWLRPAVPVIRIPT
jgi:hypothetical protein